MAKYKRVLIKLSGEALGDHGRLFDFEQIDRVADVIRQLHETGAEIAIVIGAGNIWRGRQGPAAKMTAVNADHMGMLGTAINSIAMQDAVERQGIASRVMSAVEMTRFCEPYTYRRAVRHLEKGRVVIFRPRHWAIRSSPPIRRRRCARLKSVRTRFCWPRTWTACTTAIPRVKSRAGEAAARHHVSGGAGARPEGDGCRPRSRSAARTRCRASVCSAWMIRRTFCASSKAT